MDLTIHNSQFLITGHWLVKLQFHLNKKNQADISADFDALSRSELWGLYLHLSRLNES